MSVHKKRRDKIQRQLDYRCAYCGLKTVRLTKDHVYPISNYHGVGGWVNSWKNILPACIPCNTAKGNMTLRQFDGYIRNKKYSNRVRRLRQKLNKRYGEFDRFYFVGKKMNGQRLSIDWFEHQYGMNKWRTMSEI